MDPSNKSWAGVTMMGPLLKILHCTVLLDLGCFWDTDAKQLELYLFYLV